jgi:CRP-like cAMP-binding protein
MQTRDTVSERLLSVLPAAKNRLEYLTPNDWALLADRSKIVRFGKDEFLIQSGKQTRTVYVILTGTARVESAEKVLIATLGPGEVCGEMAFLENGVAAASVKAMKEVEACGIEWSGLNDLFELFPHLGSRFYRSLAVNLSRRLREQIGAKTVPVK